MLLKTAQTRVKAIVAKNLPKVRKSSFELVFIVGLSLQEVHDFLDKHKLSREDKKVARKGGYAEISEATCFNKTEIDRALRLVNGGFTEKELSAINAGYGAIFEIIAGQGLPLSKENKQKILKAIDGKKIAEALVVSDYIASLLRYPTETVSSAIKKLNLDRKAEGEGEGEGDTSTTVKPTEPKGKVEQGLLKIAEMEVKEGDLKKAIRSLAKALHSVASEVVSIEDIKSIASIEMKAYIASFIDKPDSSAKALQNSLHISYVAKEAIGDVRVEDKVDKEVDKVASRVELHRVAQKLQKKLDASKVSLEAFDKAFSGKSKKAQQVILEKIDVHQEALAKKALLQADIESFNKEHVVPLIKANFSRGGIAKKGEPTKPLTFATV